jgi:hypothetical protein
MGLYNNQRKNGGGVTASNIPATIPLGRNPDLRIGNQRGNFAITG